MTVRSWAIKPGELKPLTRAGRLLLAARCAMRVEPWQPKRSAKLWNEALETLADAAFLGAPVKDGRATKKLARELGDRGAAECNRTDGTDEEAVGRCVGYAAETLSSALVLATVPDGPPFVKALIDVAKYAGSIAAVLAHAGLVRAPKAKDPVDFACLAMWAAIRADIPILAEGTESLEQAKRRAPATRALAPLWPEGEPSWALPL